jgi:hypothetical protein
MLLENQIEENKMGSHKACLVEMRNTYTLWLENPKEGDNLGDRGIDRDNI